MEAGRLYTIQGRPAVCGVRGLTDVVRQLNGETLRIERTGYGVRQLRRYCGVVYVVDGTRLAFASRSSQAVADHLSRTLN